MSSPHYYYYYYYYYFQLHSINLPFLNFSVTFAHYMFLACGWVIVVWKKSWKSMYKDDQQFISNTTEKLRMLLVSNLICLFPLFLFLSMFLMNTSIVSDVVKFIELALLDFHYVLYSRTDTVFLIVKLQNLSNIRGKRLADSSAYLLIIKAKKVEKTHPCSISYLRACLHGCGDPR